MSDALGALSAAGVAVWLDDISRQRLVSGNLEALRRDKHVVGVTSNPTIFAKALEDSDVYAEQVGELAGAGASAEDAARAIMADDVRDACDVMRPAYDATGGRDGRVSIEVDARLAHDTAGTAEEAKTLWSLVDRPNLFIKIPATEAGLPAITQTLARGISVNVTLIFGLARYEAVMEAFVAGLEQAKANGHDLSGIESVASFFVSRVDSEVDKRLDKIDSPDAKHLRGKAAIANARLAYQSFERFFATQRWRDLAAAGANVQRPLWASTGVKDPAYSDTRYVVELVAPDTVNTMPEATLNAMADHGEVRGDTVTGEYGEAQATLDALRSLGIEYDDVIRVLEEEGVAKFVDSGKQLLESVTQQLENAKGAAR